MRNLILCIALFFSSCLYAQVEVFESLEERLAPIFTAKQVQGMQLAIVSKDSLLFLANVGTKVGANAPITDSTLFCVASITKSFTALGIMMLVEEGKLDLQDKLREVAPEITFSNPWEAEHPIRIIHLLEHTTGWDRAQLHQFAFDRSGKTTLENLTAFPDSRVCRYPPGQFFSYTNEGASVAGYIIEKYARQKYETFVHQRIFEPLGMYHSTFGENSNQTNPQLAISIGEAPHYRKIMDNPAAGIFTTAQDMSRYLQFFLNKGLVDGKQLVQASTVEQMLYSESTLSSDPSGTHDHLEYGKGFYHYSKKGIPVYGHGGKAPGFSSNMLCLENQDRAFFLTTNESNYTKVEILSNFLFSTLTETRNAWEPQMDSHLQDDSWTGYYRPINSEYGFFYPIARILNISQIKMTDAGLVIQKKLGRSPRPLYQAGDNQIYYFSLNGIKWRLFKGVDLQGNEILQIGDTSGNLERITATQAWGNLLLVIFSILFIISIPFIALMRWLTTKLNDRSFQPNRSLQFGVMASGCLILMAFYLRSIAQSLGGGGSQTSMTAMDQWLTLTPWSFSFFLFSYLFGLFSIANLWLLIKQWRDIHFLLLKVYLFLVTLVLLLSTYYLGINGYIGMMTWR